MTYTLWTLMNKWLLVLHRFTYHYIHIQRFIARIDISRPGQKVHKVPRFLGISKASRYIQIVFVEYCDFHIQSGYNMTCTVRVFMIGVLLLWFLIAIFCLYFYIIYMIIFCFTAALTTFGLKTYIIQVGGLSFVLFVWTNKTLSHILRGPYL